MISPSSSLADPVAVQDYADDGRWLWMHRRDEGHGPVCGCLPCSDFRKRLGLPMVTPPPPAAPARGGEAL